MNSEIQNVFGSPGRLVADCPFKNNSDADPVDLIPQYVWLACIGWEGLHEKQAA
ncbi:hypothetical protein SCD_n01377 [Sulfuricella denitrificans skB26]|uniref:Uncharacterized protein n=1 Tax=Sulfuricella denitrificans (strain DSM 22764 / NBRC 105220 / skB26) TaxID=1163617 RepID=S6AC19_SULDS|nr:hypothetical protein [Sulfuricella denitrificans]BAN35203.1 hypothetical protein SCD_n01377 [Sulfuricella denitrificans skB26]